MENTINKTIGEIVAEDYHFAAIFEKHGIDFCCNGHRSLSDVCASKNINPLDLIQELEQVKQNHTGRAIDYQSWPIDLLADYIEKKHHRYVDETIPILQQYLEKLCAVHGAHHHELFEITRHFNASAGELTVHMKKEEFILFPFVRKMMKTKNSDEKITPPHFGTVKNPIKMMMYEHDNEGNRFRTIHELSNGYTPPADACNIYKVTYAMLKEFEDDLHLHIHLENNILFPKSIAMEASLN